MRILICFFLLLTGYNYNFLATKEYTLTNKATKINGISFESPAQSFPKNYIEPIRDKAGANWLGISPYAFTPKNSSQVIFDAPRQWWGERTDGATKITEFAQETGLQVMLKPQVWMWGSWVGEFDLGKDEKAWKNWEKDYTDYILTFAKIAQEKKVGLFCVGTEYKIAARTRPDFWRKLIKQVRTIYKGKITYAANWDNFEQVPFWDDLDYIGIDAYFPLITDKTPSVANLLQAWKKPFKQIQQFQSKINRPVIFTEFGYMSVDQTAWKNWENESKKQRLGLNLEGQQQAFEAFFQKFWPQDWVAGGFIWKWHYDYEGYGGMRDKDYTPQGKPAERTIYDWYTQSCE